MHHDLSLMKQVRHVMHFFDTQSCKFIDFFVAPQVLPAGNLQPTALQPAAAVGQPTQQQTAAAPPTARRQLTLTLQQKTEAQEMFRLANKDTRPEKALILGFMAGHRENPCPKLGEFNQIQVIYV